MAKRDLLNKFDSLREKHPVFTYHAFHYTLENNYLTLVFDFSIRDDIHFHPYTRIPFLPIYTDFYKNNPLSVLENIIFHIGMIELISYWKCTCSPKISVEAGSLDQKATNWWKKLYYHGLGEFFYCNGIETDIDSFVQIEYKSDKTFHKQKYSLQNDTIIPIGGGKDSVVTLEMMKESNNNIIPFIINPREASLECLNVGGVSTNFIKILRTIDPLLLSLNDKGYLNGHTPFSAMLAFYSLLVAVLSQKRNIALSNESSANESTVKDSDVNHQYSKSIAFETDFRNYVSHYISDDLNYYSFLRPLSEIQIAYLFAQFPAYFPVFKSCNAGSKIDSWCCECSKCLFTFIILSPFVKPKVLTSIFGKNLFEDETLIPILKELTGESEVKPFECVGTRDEVCIALCESYKQYDTLPTLLKHFQSTTYYQHYKDIPIQSVLTHFEKEHFLHPKEWMLLTNKFKNQSKSSE